MQSDYEKQLNDAIEKRISLMERSDYEFPKRFNRQDYFIAFGVGVISLLLIIVGAYL